MSALTLSASIQASSPTSTHPQDARMLPTAYWQFTAICQFFQLFNSNIFNLFLPTLSDKLEREILNPSEWYVFAVEILGNLHLMREVQDGCQRDAL
jgi:hypothetical protein